MELSFEYTEFWKMVNASENLIYSVAYVGVFFLYIPALLIVNIFMRKSAATLKTAVHLYIWSTWLMGTITLAILSSKGPSGIVLLLVWCSIATVNLLFAVSNATLVHKAFQEGMQGVKKSS